MQQMTEQMQTVIEAAERAAEAIRFDAEEQARRHLAEAQRKADRLTAERVGLISELTDDLVRHAANVRDHSEQMVRALEDAINSVTDKLDQPAMTDPFSDFTAPAQPGLGFQQLPETAPPPPFADATSPSPFAEAPPLAPSLSEQGPSAPVFPATAPGAQPSFGSPASEPASPPPVEPAGGNYTDLVGVTAQQVAPPPASAPPPPPPATAPPPEINPGVTDPGEAGPAAPLEPADPAAPSDPDASVAVSQQALAHATRLAIAGESRESISDSLRRDHGVADPGPIVNQVLGDYATAPQQAPDPVPSAEPVGPEESTDDDPEVPLDVILYATRRAANGVDPTAIASELRLRYGIEDPESVVAKVIGSDSGEGS